MGDAQSPGHLVSVFTISVAGFGLGVGEVVCLLCFHSAAVLGVGVV